MKGSVGNGGLLSLLHPLLSLLLLSINLLSSFLSKLKRSLLCILDWSCGEQEFYRPIITPYELELALQDEPQWGAQEYVLDFTKLLPEGMYPAL